MGEIALAGDGDGCAREHGGGHADDVGPEVVGVENLDFVPAQVSRELRDSQQAGGGIDSAAEIHFHDFNGRVFQAVAKAPLAAHAIDGDLVVHRVGGGTA